LSGTSAKVLWFRARDSAQPGLQPTPTRTRCRHEASGSHVDLRTGYHSLFELRYCADGQSMPSIKLQTQFVEPFMAFRSYKQGCHVKGAWDSTLAQRLRKVNGRRSRRIVFHSFSVSIQVSPLLFACLKENESSGTTELTVFC
jgi:hypothetical protein